MNLNVCVVIPVYNHEHVLAALLQQLVVLQLFVILVDDGSDKQCADILNRLAQQHQQYCVLLTHACNQGKGAAVSTGLYKAYQLGFSHALQLDADGQHTLQDIPRFLQAAKTAPQAVIVGRPLYEASVPKARLYGRYVTHVWVWIHTLSGQIQDAMCGFRMYPIAQLVPLLPQCRLSQRMDFDIEVLVRLSWAGATFITIPTKVIYPENGVSHFAVWRDNLLISLMHTRLFFGMLIRLPRLLWAKRGRR
jgi:glycosyltransferase involved in cell wall biosynthesis